MQRPELLQASADLSPISPLPVNSAAAGPIVANLQDRADTIDAMAGMLGVDASAVAVALNDSQQESSEQPQIQPDAADASANDDANNDDTDGSSSDDSSSDDSDDSNEAEADDHAQEGADDHADAFDAPDKNMTIASSQPEHNSMEDAEQNATESGATVPASAPTATTSQDASISQDPPQPSDPAQAVSDSLEIQQLVADLATRTAAPEPATEPPKPAQSLGTGPSSLPPRPPVPSVSAQGGVGSPIMSPPTSLPYPADPQPSDAEQLWEQFSSDERKYISEAKWERFPEGSRLFVGNLSSDKVVKRDIFDLFYRFGRLAQIAPKSSYGFVQYYVADDALRAQQALEGAELKDRRIHIEVSRVQKKEKQQRRSPDRERDRDRGRRSTDREARFDGRRDDYRPGRSPQRPDGRGGRDRDDHHRSQHQHQQQNFGGGRDRRGGSRRSRSPPQYRGGDRQDRDYRRRSPSPPYGRDRHRHAAPAPGPVPGPDLDIPPRYGSSVPDVEVLVLPNVRREMVSWVDDHFKARGLRTDVMFVTPQTRDSAIQRQIVEGVSAVVELDSMSYSKISMQVFDRSAGSDKVGFEQYRDLDPHVAAEVVIQSKVKAQQHARPPMHHHYPPQMPAAYPPQPHMPPYGMPPNQAYPPHAYPSHGMPQNPDLASLVGQTDPATLHRLLSTLQHPAAQVGQPPHPGQQPPHTGQPLAGTAANYGATGVNSHLDARFMGHGGAPAPQSGHAPPNPAAGGTPSYGPQAYPASAGGQGPPHGQGANGAVVHDLMAQLARIR